MSPDRVSRRHPPITLSIAGSDSGAGAGIQADLKTFAALGVYGTTAVTALTAQNTQGVQGVHIPPGHFVAEQIQSVLTDMPVSAIKIGMLANAEIIDAVAEALADVNAPLVLDPVMVATSGDRLLVDQAVRALRERLIPVAQVLTPNLPEAAALLGESEAQDADTMIRQGEKLLSLGARAVMLKGGHLSGERAVDIYLDAEGHTELSAPRIATPNTHGTGCTLASAIAAFMAKGADCQGACRAAKDYLTGALQSAAKQRLGRGSGPVDHFFNHREPAAASAFEESSHESE